MENLQQSPTNEERRHSSFFVGITSPSDAHGHRPLRRQVTVGGQSDHQIDYLRDTPPTFAISLAGMRMILFVVATSVFFAGFTIVSYYGVVIDTFTEEIGAMSANVEDRVQLYNTISGFSLAFVEVGLGLFMGNFLPVLLVYLHNALWFLHGGEASSKVSAALRATIMSIFPVVLMLLIGNSIRSLQAAQSIVGFETIMLVDDLHIDRPVIETVKAEITRHMNANSSKSIINKLEKDSLGLGTLHTAVEGSSAPFVFWKSQCSKNTQRAKAEFQLSEHDLDSVMNVFGFEASEWISEALDTKLSPRERYTYRHSKVLAPNEIVKQPEIFDVGLAFELFGQAKVLLDKSLADTDDAYEPCSGYKSVSKALLKRRLQAESSGGETEEEDETDEEEEEEEVDPTEGGSSASSVGSSTGGLESASGGGEASKTPVTSVPAQSLKTPAPTVTSPSPTEPSGSISASTSGSKEESGSGSEEGSGSGSEEKESDPNVIARCNAAHATLTTIGSILADPSKKTVPNLMSVVADGLEKSVENLNKITTTVKLESYEINTQLSLQTMQIDVAIDIPSSSFFTVEDSGRRIYEYEEWGSELCGSDNCVFLDLEGGSRIAQQIVLTPYQSNCSFAKIDYSSDLRGFFPRECKSQSNSAVAFSTSTYITADEYGSNVTNYDPSRTSEGGTPYLINPRRWLRIVVAKFTWKSENLANNFGVGCRREAGEESCTGISYRLPRTGRYLFSSDDALPTHKMIEDKVSLVSPLRLLQVNEASLFLPNLVENKKVIPERLDWNTKGMYKKTRWTKNALKGSSCSMLIDSYNKHITTNRYYLDRPYSAIYRAAFAYIFSNGSVTDLNDTSLFMDRASGGMVNLTEVLSAETLDNVKLKGDVILRDIRVLVPSSSFKATMIGCGVLVLLALIVVLVRIRRVEYFPPETTKAEEFIEISKDDKYPGLVHDKTLFFPESGQAVPFSDLSVDQMTLRHRLVQDRELQL